MPEMTDWSMHSVYEPVRSNEIQKRRSHNFVDGLFTRSLYSVCCRTGRSYDAVLHATEASVVCPALGVKSKQIPSRNRMYKH